MGKGLSSQRTKTRKPLDFAEDDVDSQSSRDSASTPSTNRRRSRRKMAAADAAPLSRLGGGNRVSVPTPSPKRRRRNRTTAVAKVRSESKTSPKAKGSPPKSAANGRGDDDEAEEGSSSPSMATETETDAQRRTASLSSPSPSRAAEGGANNPTERAETSAAPATTEDVNLAVALSQRTAGRSGSQAAASSSSAAGGQPSGAGALFTVRPGAAKPGQGLRHLMATQHQGQEFQHYPEGGCSYWQHCGGGGGYHGRHPLHGGHGHHSHPWQHRPLHQMGGGGLPPHGPPLHSQPRVWGGPHGSWPPPSAQDYHHGGGGGGGPPYHQLGQHRGIPPVQKLPSCLDERGAGDVDAAPSSRPGASNLVSAPTKANFVDAVLACHRTYGDDESNRQLKNTLINQQVRNFISGNTDRSNSPTGRTRDFVLCINALDGARHAIAHDFEEQVTRTAISYAKRMRTQRVDDIVGEDERKMPPQNTGPIHPGKVDANETVTPNDDAELKKGVDDSEAPEGDWKVERFATLSKANESIGPTFRVKRSTYTKRKLRKRVDMICCNKGCKCKKRKVFPADGTVEIHTLGECKHEVQSWLEEKIGLPPHIKNYVLDCFESILKLPNGNLEMINPESVYKSTKEVFENDELFLEPKNIAETKYRIKVFIKAWKTKAGKKIAAKVAAPDRSC